jgi:tRNA threonylcarbamoyladenosine biosynthesis protein TsaE
LERFYLRAVSLIRHNRSKLLLIQLTSGARYSSIIYLWAMELEFTLETMNKAVERFWNAFSGKKLFAFQGSMGAGKTSFIHALCGFLKVSGKVTSPTFSIINEYGTPQGSIYHIDLYRLKDEDDAIRAGVEDCLYSGALCFVEWPEIAAGIIPDDTVHVRMEILDSRTRKIHIEAMG